MWPFYKPKANSKWPWDGTIKNGTFFYFLGPRHNLFHEGTISQGLKHDCDRGLLLQAFKAQMGENTKKA